MDTRQLDHALEKLSASKDRWARLPAGDKLELLRQMRTRLADVSQTWVDLAVQHKGIDPGSPWVGEEWVMGPWALADMLGGLIDTLGVLAAGRIPRPMRITTRPNDQVVAHVFPNDLYDRLLLNDLRLEVWMQPEITPENLERHTAVFYQQDEPDGAVCCVLGAGNVSSISALDTVHELYVRGRAVILKMNPVNDYLGPLMEQIFRPLIDGDFLRFVYGGADVGGYLVQHPGVDAVHITGSVRTFEAIVFGTGEEGRRRKEANEPILKKPITSELGGVVPIIVVPGPWDSADIAYQAQNIVTMKLHNAGSNCVSAQSLILPLGWPQTPDLVAEVRRLMEQLPPRPAYYPGAAERQSTATAYYPQAEVLCEQSGRMLISGIDADVEHRHCFQEEFFAPILAQTSLPGDTPSSFLQNAVSFCNDRLYGTLGATILIHPKTMQQMGPVLEASIDALRYGAIGLNVWCAGAFLLAEAAWGGYPGQSMADIQSGSGFVHNSFMFEKPQKTVARGSFYASPRAWRHGDFHFAPKPLWFVTNRTAETTARRVAQFASDPNPRRLPAIFLSALRG